MLDYLNAKATDYAIILSWASQELRGLQLKRPEHSQLVARLQGKLNEVQSLLTLLQIILRIGHPRLIAGAFRTIHIIEFWTIIITYHYIPALQRQSKGDISLRRLLLPTAARCGLSWIEDIAVRLDGPQAIISVLTQTPVIFAPPQHSASLLDMAGLYHELGHNVFRRFPEIADSLAAAVSGYFADFRQKVGPMAPGKRAERNRAIEDALRYWQVQRLDEVFCDIYATFVSGPVYYFSCVDMTLRRDRDPFRVDIGDVHPPLAARVYVCHRALAPVHQNEHVMVITRNTWNTHASALGRNAEFEFICADALLDRIEETAIRSIEKYLPGARRYEKPLPPMSDTEQVARSESLEDVLNIGARILLTNPDRYADWEKEALEVLMDENGEPACSTWPHS